MAQAECVAKIVNDNGVKERAAGGRKSLVRDSVRRWKSIRDSFLAYPIFSLEGNVHGRKESQRRADEFSKIAISGLCLSEPKDLSNERLRGRLLNVSTEFQKAMERLLACGQRASHRHLHQPSRY